MGNTWSSFTASKGAKRRDDPIPTEEDTNDESRPAKRRRLDPFESKGTTIPDEPGSSTRRPLDQLISNARSSKPGLVLPSDFYGKAKTSSHVSSHTSHLLTTPTPAEPSNLATESNKFSIDDLLPESTSNFTRSLRVDVVDIIPSDDNENEVLELSTIDQPSVNIHCRVVVALFYRKPDEDQDQRPVELTRLVNECILRVTIDRNGGYSREFIDLDSFYFLPRHFYVRRKIRKSNGQWGGHENVIADKYLLTVTIEPLHSHPDWPALDIPANSGPVSERIAKGEYTLGDFRLLSSISLFSHSEQRNTALHLGHDDQPGKKLQIIPYTLNLQVRWAVPNVLTNAVLETVKSEKSPRVIRPVLTPAPVQDEPASPSLRKTDQASIEDSSANSRAQRPRKDVQTYNLKTLSTLAQGKSPRKRKPREPRTEPGSADGVTVTYALSKAEAADTGVKQQTTVPGLTCPFCNTLISTTEELRLHLHTDHSAFKFNLRRSAPRVLFFVELAKSRSGPMLDTDRSKIFQLGKPKDIFDLNKYLQGEDWTKNRYGPQHGLWPDHLTERANLSSMSSSPHPSRYSSPNTSNATDEAMDFETYAGKQPISLRQKHLVPKTVKPLYDSVTKRILEPGEEIPNSDDERDEGWLHQKQRDLVNDFTDVTPEEKDYINVWNPFIVEQHLTSDKYLPAAILRFAEAKKDWFPENMSRKREFVKHMETFLLRGVIDENLLTKCIDILRQAERQAEQTKAREQQEDVVTKDVEVSKPVSKSRALFFCICGKFTNPPNRVICQGNTCPARYFCKPCAKGFGRPITGPWKCNECVSSG